MKHTYIDVTDVGSNVVCDACGEDYTNREDLGGFLFGSYAYCPKCAKESISRIREYGEEKYIKASCPPNMQFREFVLKLRGGDNTIKVMTTTDEP
jgi:predicted RNA-binding Zn-ribbon protein involved in translation (DUF1610 family)